MKLAGLLSFCVLVGCATAPVDRDPDLPIIKVSPGGGPVEFIVGVHNADQELGEAEFSVTLVWPDGSETLAFDQERLTDWRESIDGDHHPGANVAVAVHSRLLPTRVILDDHLRDRTKVVEIDHDYRYATLTYFLAPAAIGTAEHHSHEPLRNPWSFD